MNQNRQTYWTRISLFMITAMAFIACTKDDIIPTKNPPAQTIPKVEFNVESEVIQESSYQLVQLNFNIKTSKAEKLVISLSSTNLVYGTDYVTDPLAVNNKVTLELAANSENAFIKVIPMNNDIKDETRELLFSIASEGSTLEPYGKKNTKLIFVDDDSRSTLAFAAVAAYIFENNADGYDISINIAPQSEVNGHIDITFLSADEYGKSWNSLPAAQNNRIRIPVQQGADKVSFKIKPVNDRLFSHDKSIRFNVSSTSSNFTLPINNEFILTINNDDAENQSLTIADIRELYKGVEMSWVLPVTITGTITSTKDNLDPKIIYLQDQTGGIALKLLSDYQPQVVGNKVVVDLEGGVLKEVNGNLEIHAVSNANISTAGFDIVNVEEMTIQQLYNTSNDMEGRIVTLKNVSFPDANGINTLKGDRMATDGSRNVTVKTESFASFANKVIPVGNVSVTGILVEKNGHYTIIPQTTNSVR